MANSSAVDCTQIKQQYWAAFHGIISSVLLLGISILSYKLIIHHHKNKCSKKKHIRRMTNKVYALCIIFCLITWLWIFNMIAMDTSCVMGITRNKILLIRFLYCALYLIQSYLLLVLFFLNIYYLFINSPLKLSKTILRVFGFFFIIISILCLIIIVTFSSVDIRQSVLMTCLTIFLTIGVMIAMVILYLNRLISVYKLDINDDNLVCVHFVHIIWSCYSLFTNMYILKAFVITKSTILTCISVIITFIDIPTLMIRFNVMSHAAEWINKYTTLFDIFTNYLCIIMCYPLFDKYYKQICGSLDNLCKKCLSKSIGAENLKHEKNLSDILEIDINDLDLDNINQNQKEQSFESNRKQTIPLETHSHYDDGYGDRDDTDICKLWPSSITFAHFGCCLGIFVCKLCILISVLVIIVYISFIDKSS